MRFTLTIDSDNAACQTREQLSDMLRHVSQKVHLGESGRIRDLNGNTVGGWELECEEEDEDEDEEEN